MIREDQVEQMQMLLITEQQMGSNTLGVSVVSGKHKSC